MRRKLSPDAAEGRLDQVQLCKGHRCSPANSAPVLGGREEDERPLWMTGGTAMLEAKCGVQFSSVAQSFPTLWDPMDCSTPSLPVHRQLLEFTQTHVHWVNDALQPSHPLSSPSPSAFNLSQHQGLFRRVSSSHKVVKGLEFQLQHQSFQRTLRTDLL